MYVSQTFDKTFTDSCVLKFIKNRFILATIWQQLQSKKLPGTKRNLLFKYGLTY